MSVLNVIELYAWKWLKLQILYYVYILPQYFKMQEEVPFPNCIPKKKLRYAVMPSEVNEYLSERIERK